MALRIVTQPTIEPVTLTEAKTHMNIVSSDHDTKITGLIIAARQCAELETRRALISQVWRKTLDTFPSAIRLDNPPIISVDAVQYLEAVAGVLTTLSSVSYIADITSEPGYVQPAYSYDWPTLYPEINAVRVQYTCGYGPLTTDVPQAIREWIMLMVGHYFENREASDPSGKLAPLTFLGGLLDPFRIYTLA